MKFTTKEDIEAPIEAVFDMLSEFEVFERSAIRRGAEVQRVDRLPNPGPGMEWDVSFAMRGKQREMAIKLMDFDAPQRMSAQAISPGFNGAFIVDLIQLSKTRTRLAVDIDFKPQNLSARLLVQSLRLAKASLTKRFKLRVAEYAKDLEDRYKRRASA